MIQTPVPHVVIIGAGFGGLNAALALGKAPVRVTLIDRTNHHLFQPLLYQVATAGLSPGDIAEPIRAIVRRRRNAEVLMGEVTDLDLARRLVFLGDRPLPFDYLVVAPGSQYHYFDHNEWAGAALSLKTITDATAIRRRILLAFERAEMEVDPNQRQAHLTFVLVGAGPTGVELAGAIAELARKALVSDFRHIDPRAARIVLVESGSRILTSFPEPLARKAQAALERLGVEIRTGVRVEAIDEGGVVIAGRPLEARTVIWAAGVVASPLCRRLGVELDQAGRVKVQPDLSVPGHPECFVIGDAASCFGPDGRRLPGLAPVAMQQGKYVAQVIRRRVQGILPPPSFRYRDMGSLATVGRAFAVADFGWIRFSGLLAWLLWTVVHIYYLIDFENRVLVMIQWIWAYFTFRRGARLIVQDREGPAHR